MIISRLADVMTKQLTDVMINQLGDVITKQLADVMINQLGDLLISNKQCVDLAQAVIG
ncbi:MAG TPA: hypothetical protein VFN95_11845 [Flavitalea sp.]|nr:hypothetical protein [Flavitalea sp.]